MVTIPSDKGLNHSVPTIHSFFAIKTIETETDDQGQSLSHDPGEPNSACAKESCQDKQSDEHRGAAADQGQDGCNGRLFLRLEGVHDKSVKPGKWNRQRIDTDGSICHA